MLTKKNILGRRPAMNQFRFARERILEDSVHLNGISFDNAHASRSRIVCRQSSAPYQDVLSSSDIVIGAVIAFSLAFTASFLQSRRSQNDFILSSDPTSNDATNKDDSDENNNESLSEEDGAAATTKSSTIVFDKESWEEIKRPDNYVLHNQKLKDRARERQAAPKKEQKWVVIALLAIFVPIFGIELFFALSRQIICGGGASGMEQSDWSQLLCAPVVTTFVGP